jgi:hypothetical protein
MPIDATPFPGPDFEYADDSQTSSVRWRYRRVRFFSGLSRTVFAQSPIVFRDPAAAKVVDIVTLGELLGFNSERDTLVRHRMRLDKWKRHVQWTSTIFLVGFAAGIGFIGGYVATHYEMSLALLAILNFAVSFIASFMAGIIIARITALLVDRRYADSLCVMSIAYLLVELRRDQVLVASDSRGTLVRRIEDLARSIRLLSVRHRVGDIEVQSWLAEHCKRIEQDIRERQRWILMPTDRTLEDVRRYFGQLAPMFIHGMYGTFQWPAPDPALTAGTSSDKRVLKAVFTFVLPALALTFFLWKPPTAFTSTIGLALAVWLLVGVDSAMRLGIVANVVSMLKGMKELK